MFDRLGNQPQPFVGKRDDVADRHFADSRGFSEVAGLAM
jgi:hypothetical protein